MAEKVWVSRDLRSGFAGVLARNATPARDTVLPGFNFTFPADAPFSVEAVEPVLKKARDRGIVVVSHEASNITNVDYDIEAFDNLAYRVDLEAIQGVVTTMIQTERYGTPLASALRVLSAEFRNERMMRAEEKAARLPAIMTVPLILFILPTLFIVILGPAGCSIADAFSN